MHRVLGKEEEVRALGLKNGEMPRSCADGSPPTWRRRAGEGWCLAVALLYLSLSKTARSHTLPHHTAHNTHYSPRTLAL